MSYIWSKGIHRIKPYKEVDRFKPLCFHCNERAVLSIFDNYGWVHCCLGLALEILTKGANTNVGS